jgi:alkylhydroperoxidase/carboxymuconolactone decarboxylase family protein YurZ
MPPGAGDRMPHVGETWSAELSRTSARLPAAVADLIAGMIALVGHDVDDARSALASAQRQGVSDGMIDDLVSALVLAFGTAQWTTTAWLAIPPRADETETPDADGDAATQQASSRDVRAAIARHFADTEDEVPPPIEALVDRLPELAELYRGTRQQMFADTPHVDPALRELLLAVISARAGYVDGGTRHLRRAYALGLPRETLRLVLTVTVLIEGAASWPAYGRALWEVPDG